MSQDWACWGLKQILPKKRYTPLKKGSIESVEPMKKSGVRNYTPITEDGSLVSFLSTPNDAQAHGVPPPQHRGQSSFPYYESNGGDGIAALDRRPRAVKPNLEGLGDDNVNIAARTNAAFMDPRCAEELPGEDDDDGLGDKYGVGIEGDDGDGEGDGEGDDEGVCQPGQEQTGRWTRKEHELFLDALKKYGKVSFFFGVFVFLFF